MDVSGSGLCPLEGLGIGDAEPLGSATIYLNVREYVVRMGGGWNWLRIVHWWGLVLVVFSLV
jgi:hypothetical protein